MKERLFYLFVITVLLIGVALIVWTSILSLIYKTW